MIVFSFLKRKWLSLLIVESLIFNQAVYASDNSKDVRSIVPAKYGSVRDIHLNPKSDKWVIHIQDAHCNFDAQQNISNILKKMVKKNCLDLILLEGSSGKVNPAPLKNYPDKTARNTVSGYLLKSADISGSEYFLITQDENVPVLGMENRDTYEKNLKVLWKIMDLKTENNSIIDKLDSYIESEKPKLYSDKLVRFDSINSSFRTHSIDLEEYLNYLKENIEINPQKYPVITKINKINLLKKEINFTRIEEETTEIFNLLSHQLNRDKLAELFRLNLAFKVGETPPGEFYCYIVKLLETENINTSDFRNILLYGKLVSDYESIDHASLDKELKSIEEFYTGRLFRNEKEKSLYNLNKISAVLKDYLNLTLSASDKDFFIENKSLFAKESVADLMKSLSEEKYEEFENDLTKLDNNILEVGQFYQLAQVRDEIIVGNAIKEIEKSKSKWTALIAGGFHTDGICQLLKNKDVNYAVVVPKIKTISDQSLYLSVITHTKNPLEKFIESAINSLADSSWLAENPIGFDVSRKQVKLTKAVSLFLAESADNIHLKNPVLSTGGVIDELNKVIAGYDTQDIKITDFKRINQYRFYKMEIHGQQMFYYFEDKDAQPSDFRKLILSDLHSILAREIDLADKKSVTVFSEEIMAVLGPKLDELKTAESETQKTEPDTVVQANQIRNAILDYAFLREEFNINEMMGELRMKHRFDFDFRKDIQPVIEKLIDDNWIYGNFQNETSSFALAEDVRLAYYLTIMSESENFFPDIEQLESFNVKIFENRAISAVSVEAGMSVDSIVNLLRQIEQGVVNGKQESVFEYSSAADASYEGRIIANKNQFNYLRLIRKKIPENNTVLDDNSLDDIFEPVGSNLIRLEDNDKSVLVLSIENGAYNISLIEPGNDKRLETILFQDRIIINDQAKENLNKVIHELMARFSSYVFLQGLLIISDDRVKYVKPDELQNAAIEEMIAEEKITDLIMDEINKLNILTAYQGEGAPLESLTAVFDEDMSEQDIVGKLSTYSPNALIEIGKTTRNPAYLRVLAKNAIYSMPNSRIKIGDYVTHKIKTVLIDNEFTPTDSLIDLVNDSLFFGHLLKNNPDKIKDLIKHSHAMGELIELIADKIGANEWQIPTQVIEDLKQAIIKSPLADEVLLMQYFQDPSIKVRISLARSAISDIMADDPAEDVKLEVAKNPNTSLAYLHRFAEPGVSKQIKLALASNMMIDKYIVDRLIAENDEDIKVMLAKTLANGNLHMFRNMPDQIDKYLLRLIDECGDSVDAAIASAKNKLSFNVLDRLIIQGPKIQLIVADRMDLTQDLITKLYSNSNEDVKNRLVYNISVDLPFSEYRKAIVQSRNEKDGWKLRFAITKKHKLAVPIMQELLRDSNARVRAGLATREDLPEEMFDELSKDPLAFVRSYVANNAAAPIFVIKRLGDDEANLSDGLIAQNGQVQDGFTKETVISLEKKGKTVLSMLSMNRKILDVPRIYDKLFRDYKYHGGVLRMISRLHESAINFYKKGEYEQAYDLLKSLGESKYAPFGVLFDLGNIAYRLHNTEKAMKYYSKSYNESNNVCSFIAMYFLKKEAKVPDTILNLSVPLQTILQNFHNAKRITESEIPVVMSFISSVTQPIPDDLVPSYLEPSVTWEDLLKYEDYENLIALKLYALRDVINKGYLNVSSGLTILENVFKSFSDPHQISGNWKTFKKSFWQEIITKSILNDQIKGSLLDSPSDQVEFFLRGGVRGVIKYADYQDFRNKIVMDNVPSFLREDVARSVWIEFIDLTEDILFSEPNYFSRLSLVRQQGSFGGYDNALRISLSLSGGKYRYGVGDVNSVVRSEGAHSISSGIFRNLGMNMDVDELQDRSSALRFPKEMDDPNLSKYIANTYSEHDQMMIELFNIIIRKNSIDDLIWDLKNFKGNSIIEDYAIRNALTGLKEDYSNPFAQRILGEAFFYLYRHEPNLEIIDERMPELMEKLRALKEQIDKFSWDVRVFFDGGCYLITYRQPFPVIAPPVDLILGTEAVERMSGQNFDEHYSGEWLHYLLRMRIRDLIREGKLVPANLHRFYRTVVIYLSSVTRNGELFKRLNQSHADINQGATGKAVMDLLNLLSDAQLRGLTDEMKTDLLAMRSIVTGMVKIDRNKLMRIVQKEQIDKFIRPNSELYPIASSYANLIIEKLNTGKDTAAAILAAGFAEKLYANDFHEYGREIENVFLPVGDNIRFISDKITNFMTKYSELRKNSASNLKEIVNIISNISPENVMKPIENRQILDAEPEKVILKEVGKQLTENLFLTGEIGFSQFVKLVTDYYSSVYKNVKENRTSVDPLMFTNESEQMWKSIHSQLFPFLNEYNFVNVKNFLAGMRERMQTALAIARSNSDTTRKPTILYTHWSSVVVPFVIMGISLKTIALLLAGWAGFAVLLYASAKTISFAISKIKQQKARKKMVSLENDEIDPGKLYEQVKRLPLLNPKNNKWDKYLLIDVDGLLDNWDFMTVAGYFIKKQDVKMFLHSTKYTRNDIIRRLSSIGIDVSKIEIISADDYRIDKKLDVADYLRFNYGIDLKQILLLSAYNSQSKIKSKLLREGSVSFEFDMKSYNDIRQIGRDLSTVFQFRSGLSLPAEVKIDQIDETNPSSGWFKSMNGSKATFSQFVDYVANSGKVAGLSDIYGVSFVLSERKPAKKTFSNSKLNLISELIDSSL